MTRPGFNPFAGHPGMGYPPAMGYPQPVGGGIMAAESGMLRGVPGLGGFAGDLNGHIPDTFADQTIKFRIPYTMYGEKVVLPNLNGQFFPDGLFLHTLDKPFEVWRMHTVLTGTDDASPPVIFEPQPSTLGRRVRLSVTDLSKNEPLTSDPTMPDAMQTDNFQTWEWDVPYTITRQEGFVVQVDADAFPLVCVNQAADGSECSSVSRQVDQILVSVAFQGFLIILQPASESR